VPGGGLGVMLTCGTGGPERWAASMTDFASLEDSGCSAIWPTDHLLWAQPMPEALVMCALAIAATERCFVGPGVLQLPLRRPAAVAKSAATLEVVSGGRFLLGLGAGEHREEFDRCGADFGRRGAELDAGIAALRAFWRPSEEQFAQRPVPGTIPIWVGGRSPRALERAATLGDGWMPIFVGVESYARGLAELDARVVAAGREPGSVARAVAVITSVTGPGWSRADALAWAGRLWAMEPSRFEHHVVTGTADACAERLAAYQQTGADHVSVLLATDDPVRMFAELAGAWGRTLESASTSTGDVTAPRRR